MARCEFAAHYEAVESHGSVSGNCRRDMTGEKNNYPAKPGRQCACLLRIWADYITEAQGLEPLPKICNQKNITCVGPDSDLCPAAKYEFKDEDPYGYSKRNTRGERTRRRST